jgi:Cof subfamily protein (haloacid dehalogenase superfamily)
MNKNIKMVTTDLDQTFLRTDKSISQYSLDIIKKCKERGILIAIATARSEQEAEKYINLIKPDIVISNGGALVRYRDRIIYNCMLSASISDKLIQDCMANSNVGEITVDTGNSYYSNSKDLNQYVEYSNAQYNNYVVPLNSMTYKISVVFFDKNSAVELASKYPECSFLGFHGENKYRFAHKDATKFLAINELIKHLNINLKQVVIFGDDYNDIEMLKNCSNGVAVSNAIKEVLSVATHITKSNDEDGVARFINQNIL